jgi:hypothetical protein
MIRLTQGDTEHYLCGELVDTSVPSIEHLTTEVG